MIVVPFDQPPPEGQAAADQVERAKALLDDLLFVIVPLLTPITGRAGLQAFVAGRVLRAQLQTLGDLR